MPSLASNGRASFATYSALLALEDLSGRALEGKKAIRDGWNAWDARVGLRTQFQHNQPQLDAVTLCYTVTVSQALVSTM